MDQRGDWRITDALHYEHGRGDPFAAAVRATRMPMVITNPRLADNPIIFCNQAFQSLTGYTREEIVGRNCRFLQGEGTDPAEVGRIRRAIEDGTDVEADLLNYRKDGSPFWNALYLSPVRDDSGQIIYFFASQLDVTDRRAAEHRAIARRLAVEQEVQERTADLRHALEAKTVLLHELDHRVKNNLTMVGSLLRLQARSARDPALATGLEAMLQRVDALATVHRRLYQSADVTRFDIGAFLDNLAADLLAAGSGQVEIVTDLAPIEIAPGHAAALGLVLNEIVGNCFKHAFGGGRGGTLCLRTAIEGETAIVEIGDDGPGFPPGTPPGFGRTLTDRLSRQVGIRADWRSTASGTNVVLSIPLANVS